MLGVTGLVLGPKSLKSVNKDILAERKHELQEVLQEWMKTSKKFGQMATLRQNYVVGH